MMQMLASINIVALVVGLAAADYLHLMQRRAHLTEDNLTAVHVNTFEHCEGVDCDLSKDTSGSVQAASQTSVDKHGKPSTATLEGFDKNMLARKGNTSLSGSVDRTMRQGDGKDKVAKRKNHDDFMVAHRAAVEREQQNSQPPQDVYPMEGEDYVMWDLCKSWYRSNLGGQGPKGGNPELRFHKVATVLDSEGTARELDLAVEVIGEYKADSVQSNGRRGCFGQINVASSDTGTNSVTLRFNWYFSNTLIHVKPSKYYFTMYDIDGTADSDEAITFYNRVSTVYTSDNTELTQSGQLASGLTFTAAGFTNDVPMPTDPASMTAEQKNRAVTLEYLEQDYFKLTFSVSGGNGGRNFAFGGFSSLAHEFEGHTFPTPAPPTPPPTTCAEGGTCKIYEDPHIEVFDGMRIALLSVHAQRRKIADYGFGDWWLVRSSDIHVQARYLPDPDLPNKNLFVRSVAVGGPFLNGSTLILGSLEDGITWNGDRVLESQTSVMQAEIGTGFVKAKRHTESHLVQDMTQMNAGVDIDMPRGVKLTVNRYKRHVNVFIEMPPAVGGQDGLCGNFNCNAGDDTLDMIMKHRNPRVLPEESLFKQ